MILVGCNEVLDVNRCAMSARCVEHSVVDGAIRIPCCSVTHIHDWPLSMHSLVSLLVSDHKSSPGVIAIGDS
jgi:hypothetical protein